MILPVAFGLLISTAPDATLRRFALVAGANDGGAGRVTLRYANSDARAVSRVLTQLGGVDARDVAVVQDPSPAQLSQALEELGARLREARRGPSRVEVFFYYSGHSDEDGLLLKGERYPYSALRSRLDALPAEVRIAVLDSCASGALNLAKGGSPRPSFLVDAASSLSGHAFLTSSSADEAAQESERLQASIFTHYFLSGLRGAADVSRDGRVTLAEAYQYAFSETLARTTSTRVGPQRPGWDIQLVGTGDLVLTDLRASDAKLVLDATLRGRVNVFGAKGGLVVEVSKAAGKALELGLEAGDYRVVVDDLEGHVGEAKLSLPPQSAQILARSALSAVTLEATVRRGDEPRPSLPVDVALLSPISISGLQDPRPRVNLGLGVLGVRVGAVEGVLLGSVGAWSDGAVEGVALGGVLVKTGSLLGAGVSGVALVADGDVRGATAATITVGTGDVDGAHASVASVFAGDLSGVQLGVADVVAGHVYGAQLGVVTYAGDAQGAQLGVLNIGGHVQGAQLGVLNIARSVSGAQVGVLNIAETSSAPVGLVNVIRRGEFHVSAWANETSRANVALKLGSASVYSFVMAGLNPATESRPVHLGLGLGLGLRLRLGDWYGELEGSCESLLPAGVASTTALSSGARINVGYQLFEDVAVFAGPQVHVLYAVDTTYDVRDLAPWGFDLSSRVRLVPGLVVGVQFF